LTSGDRRVFVNSGVTWAAGNGGSDQGTEDVITLARRGKGSFRTREIGAKKRRLGRVSRREGFLMAMKKD